MKRKKLPSSRQIELDLEETAEKFKVISEQTLFGIAIVQDSVVKYVNEAVAHILEYSVREILGWGPVEFGKVIHPEDRSFAMEQALKKQTGESDVVNQYSYRIITKSGTEKWLDQYSRSIIFGGKPANFVTMIDRTEKMTAERALSESEKQYRKFVDNALVGVYKTSLTGEILFANHALMKILEYETLDDLVHASVLGHYKDKRDRERLIAELKEHGSVDKFETEIFTRRGKTRNVLLSAVLEEDTLSGMVMDITRRKQAEVALHESEKKYRHIIEHSNDAIYLLVGRTFTFVNRKFQDMFGLTLTDVNKPDFDFMQLVAPKSRKAIEKRIEHVTRGEIPTPTYEFTALDREGNEIEVEASVSYLKYHDEYATQGILRDITERKRAEEALQRSESHYRTTIDSMDDLIHVVDEDLRIILYNKALEEKARDLGFTVVKNTSTIFDAFPFLPEHTRREYEHVFRSGKKLITEERSEINGKSYDTETRKIPVFEGGKVHRVITIIRDISEQKMLEEQFYHAQKMESIGRLAGGIAHDFNNILAVILGYTGLLKMKFKDLATQERKAVDLISKTAEKAAGLTKQLLGLARGEKFTLAPLNVNDVIRETFRVFEKIFEKRIRVRLNLDEDVFTVEADRNQLEQVFTNLIINAKDAMPEEGTLTITTGNTFIGEIQSMRFPEHKTGNYVEILVADTGTGMSDDVKERIFDPFFTTKEEGTGTGLGLSTVYSIIKNHRGYITVTSVPDRGTTFSIYLPVSGKNIVDDDLSEEPVVQGSETILVVDDERDLKELTKLLFENIGYNVVPAKDGVEAVEIFTRRKEEIDLVLLDMIMPHKAGMETYYELRKIDPTVKVVLISGYSQNEKTAELLGNGVKGFIQKPLSFRELAKAIRKHLTA